MARNWWRSWTPAAFVAGAVCVVLFYSISRLSGSHIDSPLPNSRPKSGPTAIIILGGGLMRDGSLPSHTTLRVERAVQLFHELQGNAVIIPLSGGTPHKPNPLDIEGFPIWESTAAAKRLLELGIPADKILEENFSLDTIGNVRRPTSCP